MNSFNTQPPEGGWLPWFSGFFIHSCFNTQPPEGGWFRQDGINFFFQIVSTLSRLKAAGKIKRRVPDLIIVSTLSRLKAAGSDKMALISSSKSFQHSAA